MLLSPGGWTPGGWSWPEEKLFIESRADCIATANGWTDKDNPKVYRISKPVIMDLDHVAPGQCQPALIWKAFTRGYHFNLYDGPFEQPQQESRAWQVARENLRLINVLVKRVGDITPMNPDQFLCSTGYCLAIEGKKYIVYSEQQKDFQVNGLQAGQEYRCEWISTTEARFLETSRVTPETRTHRFSPVCREAVLLLTL